MKEPEFRNDQAATLMQSRPLTTGMIVKRILGALGFSIWAISVSFFISLSEEVTFVMFGFGAVLTTVCLGHLILASRKPPFACAIPSRSILGATLILCIAIIYITIITLAAKVVRESGFYHALFLAVGVFQLGLAIVLSGLYGVGAEADAVHRANTPAAIAISGAMVGFSLAYAGANIGEGATIWTTLGPAALAWALLALLWMAAASLAGISDAIAIDRDFASAFRLAGMLGASGLVLGRAMAGDYVSAAATLRDAIVSGWPVIVIAVATILMQRAWRPTVMHPKPNRWPLGILPASLMLLAAIGWVIAMGAPQ